MKLKSLVPTRWHDKEDRVDPFRSLHREIDKLFESFGSGFATPTLFSNESGLRTQLMPSVNVSETETTVEISAELPGVEEDDVNVTVSDNLVTISGEKKSETEDKNKDFHVVERSYGRFERIIPLSFDIDGDEVDAQFKKGVLTISMQKPPEATSKMKKVEIKSAA